MKQLTLIRHAKSSWKDPRLPDFQRPLKERGKEDAPRMGRLLREKLGVPELFLSSPARRALKTALLMGSKMGLGAEDMLTDRRLYHAGITDLYAVLSELGEGFTRVFLCAHNPGITEFLNFLTLAGIEKVPTCGVAHILLPVEHWKDIAFGCGELVFFDCPGNHR
ncbi:MAG: SixA phosphatase family protein [Spirochaetota bacterium]